MSARLTRLVRAAIVVAVAVTLLDGAQILVTRPASASALDLSTTLLWVLAAVLALAQRHAAHPGSVAPRALEPEPVQRGRACPEQTAAAPRSVAAQRAVNRLRQHTGPRR